MHWPDMEFPPINLWSAPHQGEEVASPCVAQCRVQGNTCTGCGRTLEEITQWSSMTPTQRYAVIERLRKTES